MKSAQNIKYTNTITTHASQENETDISSSQKKILDISDQHKGAFQEAVNNSLRGARILYHNGEFCAGPHRIDARNAYDAGLVLLTVRKNKAREFAYIAIVL